MMKHFINILILCVGIVVNVDAQTFTQRLQTATKGGAKVTIHQDQAIDELVNGPQNTVQKNTTPTQKNTTSVQKNTTSVQKNTTPVQKKTKKVHNNKQTTNSHQQAQKPVENKESITTKPLESEIQQVDTTSLEKKPGYKVTGYRVQVFAGGNSRKDKQKAEQTGSQLRALFPLESVYVHFYSPRWICRVGNYRTYEEAHQMLQEVKKLGYSSATIVKGKITVQY